MIRVMRLSAVLICVILLAGCRNGRPANTVLMPSDAEGREIGVLSGTSSYRFAAELGNVRSYYSTRELMDALKSGALDCVIMEGGPADSLASRTSGVTLLSEPLLEYELRFAIAKENADLTRAVNSALATLIENGTIRGLRDKHVMGKSYTYEPPAPAATYKGTLTLAVPGNFPPYSYKTEDGQFAGFDIDVAHAVCDLLGVELNVVESEFKKLVTTVQFGKADLAAGCLYDNETDRELTDFSDSYTHFSQHVLVRK